MARLQIAGAFGGIAVAEQPDLMLAAQDVEADIGDNQLAVVGGLQTRLRMDFMRRG